MLILILHFLIRSMYNYITREIHGNYLLSKFFFLNKYTIIKNTLVHDIVLTD